MRFNKILIALFVCVTSTLVFEISDANAQLFRRRCNPCPRVYYDSSSDWQSTYCSCDDRYVDCKKCEILWDGSKYYPSNNPYYQCALGCYCPLPAVEGGRDYIANCKPIPSNSTFEELRPNERKAIFFTFYDKEDEVSDQVYFFHKDKYAEFTYWSSANNPEWTVVAEHVTDNYAKPFPLGVIVVPPDEKKGTLLIQLNKKQKPYLFEFKTKQSLEIY